MPFFFFIRYLLLGSLAILILPSMSLAQVGVVNGVTSTPVPGSGHDYIQLLSETVNPSNGQISLRIQTPMPKGRGITIPFAFTYDSGSAQYIRPRFYPWFGQAEWVSAVSGIGGWSHSFAALRYDTWEQDVSVVTGYNGSTPIYTTYPCYYASNYVFNDASGGPHSLNGLASLSWGSGMGQPPSGCPFSGGNGGPSAGGGDSAFRATLPSNSVGIQQVPVTITDDSGTVYYFATSGSTNNRGSFFGAPSYIEDRNGNKLLTTQTTNSLSVTDTLSRPLISISGFGGFGTTGSTTAFTLAGLTYQMNWTSASRNFTTPSTWVGPSSEPNQNDSCNPIGTASGTLSVASQIVLPNSQHFQFYYGADNPNSAFNNPYGLLSEIDYPSGAWVRYTWKPSDTMNELEVYPGYSVGPTPVQDGCTYQYKTPVVATRTVGLAGSSSPILTQTFTYSTTWAAPLSGNVGGTSWTQKTTSVGHPANLDVQGLVS